MVKYEKNKNYKITRPARVPVGERSLEELAVLKELTVNDGKDQPDWFAFSWE